MATTEYEPSRHVERFLTRSKGLIAESTVDSQKSSLKHFEKWLQTEGIDIMNVDGLTIEDWVIAQSNDGYAGGTIRKRFYAVKVFYDFLSDKLDVIEESPFEDVEKSDLNRVMTGTRKVDETREEISYITPEEIDTLCEHVPNPRLRNELMIRLMFQTGVRESELAGIRLQDIDTDERSIRIHAQKTSTNRTVYYQPDLDFILDRWINGGYRAGHPPAASSPYLFVTNRSERIENQRMNKIVKKAADNAGIQSVMYTDNAGNGRKKVTSHVLRHSHAIESLKSGIDIERVRRHLGHASLEQTQKYLRLIDDDVKEAYQRFGG